MLVLVAGVCHAARAQAPAPPSRPQDAAPGIGQEFVVEQKHVRVKYETDGSGERRLKLRVKVLSESAVREWGRLPLPYAADTEQLQIDRVQVQKPDGTLTANATGDVQDLAVRPPGDPAALVDLRQKQIAVATLRPGDILDVEATWKITRPVTPGHFWFEYALTDSMAVLDERLEVDLPVGSTPIVRNRPGAVLRPAGEPGRVENGRRLYQWTATNVTPRSANEETYKGDGSPADVRLTSYQSWDAVAQWFDGLMSVPASPEVTTKALALTAGITERSKKIDAIYDFVAKEIRYLSLSFGIGRFAPHAPGDVLKNGYGDCKDKAALLGAMLSAVGVESRPVLLHTDRSLDAGLASPLELDHVITVVPDGNDSSRWTWMDSTTEVAPVGMLPATIRGKRALLVGSGGRGTRLITTPADPPMASIDRVSVNGTIDSIGALTATVTFSLSGDGELLARSLLRTLPREAVKEFVRGLAETFGLKGDFSDETAGDPAATGQPFQITAKLRESDVLNWAAATSAMRTLPSLSVPYEKDEERRGNVALEFGSPHRLILSSSIELPPGYELQAPANVTTGTGPTYSSRYLVDGRRVTIEREFSRTVRALEPERFGEYAAMVNAVKSDLAQTVKIRAAKVGVPVIPADATALALYAAGFNAHRAKNFDAAITIWTRATELDPKMVNAWNALGLTYDEKKQYDKAIAAYQKVLEIDSYDKRTHRDLGRTYEHAGRPDDAVKSFLKHLELNPVDGDALRGLGDSYLQLGRYAEAADALEKVSVVGKLDAWGFTLLGEALVRSNQRAKASAAFEHAIELSPKPQIWAKISWVLADVGVDPDWARTLALQTETQVASTMLNVNAAGVDAARLDLMERLAWAWDALGMVALRKGALEEAERYGFAAWTLGRQPLMAFNLARIYERRGQMTDAVNYYLAAYAISREPSSAVRAAVKRLVPTEDRLPALLDGARGFALSLISLPEKGPPGRARFAAIVGPDRRVIDLRFVDGDDSLRILDESLRRVRPHVDLPSPIVTRVAITLYAACHTDHGCAVSSVRPPGIAPQPR
jgi:tetratricopeptide (TPR) repeat protein